MKQRVRHLLSVLLVCAMVLSLLPISVLAEELETPLTTVTEPTEVPEVESDTEEDPEPAIEPEEEITPNPAQTIYVSSEGNDVNDGSNEKPYATLAKAVEQAEDGAVIYVMTNLTVNTLARVTDKHVTVTSVNPDNPVTLTRGSVQGADNNQSHYNSAMIEVTTFASEDSDNASSVTLTDIILDDAGKHDGTYFAQTNSSSISESNLNFVQDSMVTAHGKGNRAVNIILGEGAVLKDYGGMSAVYGTMNAHITMKAGAVICDETVADRSKSAKPHKEETGPAGAVWLQGAEFIMETGAEIRNMVGRAVYADGGSATIGGTIRNIKADTDMWQGITGIGVHGRGDSDITLTDTCEIVDFDTNAKQGSVVGMYASDLDMKNGAEISNIKGTMAVYMDDIGNDYRHTALINGLVDTVENNPVMRSWYGHIEIGPTGVVQNCTASQVLYTNNGSKYTISGKLLNNSGTALYLANQSGGRVYAVMNEGAVISGTNGVAVRVNNGSQFIMNGGTITNNTTGVQVSGKDEYKGVEFIMNGGTISDNRSGISYTIEGESKVQLNGGTLKENGSNYQISAAGGSAQDAYENIYIASGVLQGNTTVSTSFGTMTFDEAYPNLGLGKAKTDAQNKIKELVLATPEQSNWNVKGSPLWFKATSDSLHFSVKRSSVEKGIGLYAGYIPLKADGTPADGATLTLVPLVNSDTIDVTLTNLVHDTSYALSFVVTDKYYITVNPADITVYMGGERGSDGVVDNGHIVGSNSLPEPGFVFDLPEGVTDISKIIFQTTDPADSKTWTIEPYDGNSEHEVYKIVPAEGQDPLRVEFTDPITKETVSSDNFTVGTAVNKTFDMGIYKDSVGTVEAVVTGDTSGTTYGIILNTGKLHVRGTTSKVQYADLNQTPVSGKPGISAEEGTTFTINDSDVVANKEGIALLFDNIIENTSSESNRTQLLQKKADETINKPVSAGMVRNYDMKYLDLVDRHNGNTWVKASEDVTVSWPYPAGTDKTTEFTLLHFEDLHRDMASNEVAGDIASGSVSEVRDIKKADTHIEFKVGTGGFSPFALVWESTKPVDPDPGTRDDYTLHYVTNGGNHLSSETKSSSWTKDYEDLPTPVRDGYTFEGWYWDLRLTEPVTGDVKVNKTTVTLYAKWSGGSYGPDDTGVSGWLETDKHNAFLSGYPDGSFQADKNMTRAEVAQMFYALLLDKNVTITKSFSDVPSDAWYAKAVNTLSSLGMLGGYPDGTFRPDAPITRAEFAAIALAFAYDPASASCSYTDVSANAWYYTYVAQATTYGWIGGYPDGSFRPNNSITRAEVAVIVNNMLGRNADESYIDRNADELVSFVDLSKTHWAYYTIMEATNTHDYTTSSNGESWKA